MAVAKASPESAAAKVSPAAGQPHAAETKAKQQQPKASSKSASKSKESPARQKSNVSSISKKGAKAKGGKRTSSSGKPSRKCSSDAVSEAPSEASGAHLGTRGSVFSAAEAAVATAEAPSPEETSATTATTGAKAPSQTLSDLRDAIGEAAVALPADEHLPLADACSEDSEVYPVVFHLYDAGPTCNVQYKCKVISAVGTGPFHCGVEVDGFEFSYGHCDKGSGVFSYDPKECGSHHWRESIVLKECHMCAEEIALVIADLGDYWHGNQYDMLKRNSCHFCHTLCRTLEAGDLPNWVLNLAAAGVTVFEREAAAHPREVSPASRKSHQVPQVHIPPLSILQAARSLTTAELYLQNWEEVKAKDILKKGKVVDERFCPAAVNQVPEAVRPCTSQTAASPYRSSLFAGSTCRSLPRAPFLIVEKRPSLPWSSGTSKSFDSSDETKKVEKGKSSPAFVEAKQTE